MKRRTKITLLALAALFIGVGTASAVTENSPIFWARGILYAGSSKVQLTNSAGNLLPSPEALSNSLTALSGGGQSGATVCPATAKLCIFTTVAAAGDSALLVTPSATGVTQTIMNLGAKQLAVYPQTGATINALSANSAFSINPNETVVFRSSSTTAWYTSWINTLDYTGATGGNLLTIPTNLADAWDLKDNAASPVTLIQAITTTGSPQVKIPSGTLFTALGGLNETGTLAVTGAATVSTTLGVTGLTTATGGLTVGAAATTLTQMSPPTCDHVSHNQASAVQLTGVSAVAVVANSGDSCLLPTAAAGLTYLFCDGDSAHTAQLFCASPCTINGVATATGITVSPGCVWCTSNGTNWFCTKN